MQAQSWYLIGQIEESVYYLSPNDVVIDGAVPYVSVYLVQKPVVMKYNGSSWETIGEISLTVTRFSFDVEDGMVYLAYSVNNSKISVVKSDGGEWEFVGDAEFANGGNVDIDVINGNLYIVYSDSDNNNKASVCKFNGESWDYLGSPGISSNYVTNNVLEIKAAEDDIYIVYGDIDYNEKATMMKYHNNEWSIIGEPGFSGNALNSTKALVVWNATPYVLASNLNRKAVIYQYNGTSWEILGDETGLGIQTPQYKSIACSSEGVLFVSYTDPAYYGRNNLFVKKYINNTWEDVGADISTNQCDFGIIDIDNNAKPYIIYTGQDKGTKVFIKVYKDSDGIEDIQDASLVSLSPNPAFDKVKMINHGSQCINSYSIYDQLGREIMSDDVDIKRGEVEEIDISSLPNGIYIIEMDTDVQKISTKLIKYQ